MLTRRVSEILDRVGGVESDNSEPATSRLIDLRQPMTTNVCKGATRAVVASVWGVPVAAVSQVSDPTRPIERHGRSGSTMTANRARTCECGSMHSV